jgi:hypothetical protein
MSWIGWLLSLLAGVACAVLGRGLLKMLLPLRLRYVQAYRSESERDRQRAPQEGT